MRTTFTLLLASSLLLTAACGPGSSTTAGDTAAGDASVSDAPVEDTALSCPAAMPAMEIAEIVVRESPEPQIVADFTAPMDPWGGVLEVTALEGGFLGAAHLGTSTANTIAVLTSSTMPNRVVANFAAAPGQTYSISVGDWGGMETTYRDTLTFRYRPLRDCYEPNNTSAQAKPIALNAPIEAYLHAGITAPGRPTADDYADWYRVTVPAAGTLHPVVNAPVAATVTIYDAAGTSELAGGFYFEDRTEGPSVGVGPGTYLVRVGVFGSPCPAPGTCSATEWTRPYQLTPRLE